tara:strand:- start:2087 stop:2926 length:840 start_codon:yes stop_codon:yes gene_type:complete
MKRYRLLPGHFDTRIAVLMQLEDIFEVNPKPEVKRQIEDITLNLTNYYGPRNINTRLQNLRDIGSIEFSIMVYHNQLLEQIRDSFIYENYYPALTAACTLGERILNHLILDLKEGHIDSKEYNEVADQKSFSNWKLMINTLDAWDILLPEVVSEFKTLMKIRHKSIHFNQKLTSDLRKYSLDAIMTIQKILFKQFSGFGNQPWFITAIPGEIYLRKEWESKPFVKTYYIPNCILVSPYHRLEGSLPFKIVDKKIPENQILSDEEFIELRKSRETPANNV